MALNARMKKKTGDYIVVDVLYEDGSRTSHRKIPTAELIGDDKDGAAKAYIEAQDRKISEASGKPRADVKAILPAGQ